MINDVYGICILYDNNEEDSSNEDESNDKEVLGERMGKGSTKFYELLNDGN